MRPKKLQSMKCLSMLEWNKTIYDSLSHQYTSLAKQDEKGCFSTCLLPDTLAGVQLFVVDIESQLLALIEDGKCSTSYPVSTALNGAGNRENTDCTPLGWHNVAKRIGDKQAIGTVFKGRVSSGVVASCLDSVDEDDLITSRILWLSGLQPGINQGGSVDSYSRYVYIHGTAQEHLIGSAVSHGCIRMRNKDVIDLFNLAEEGAIVFIGHNIAERNSGELP